MLETFFESLPGQAVTLAMIILFLALIYFSAPRTIDSNRVRIRILSLSSLLIALAFVLNNFLPVLKMPQGGSVTLGSMFFLFLAGYVFGPRVGIFVGVTYGLLDFLFSPYAYHIIQVIMDYPLAFGMIGVGSILYKTKYGLYTGYLLGMAGRFLVSFLSGLIFFSEYAPEGYSGFTWAVWYNLTYLGTEALLTTLVLMIPVVHSVVDRLRHTYTKDLYASS
jgi:thiamine transporter